jgi:hypothetical protein
MPSPMKFFKSDPMRKGRGKGFYYKRGGYKRGWMSKYSGSQDGSYRPRKNTKKLQRRYEHTGDRNRMKRTTHRVKVSPKKWKVFKGFF